LEQQWEQWRENRRKRLKSPDGWFSLCGLFWLKEGENTFGSDSSNDIVLPEHAVKFGGSVKLDKSTATAELLPKPELQYELRHSKRQPNDTSLFLQHDDDGAQESTIVFIPPRLTMFVIKRGERFGVRVKDKLNPPLLEFDHFDYFPYNPKWCVEATFEPHNPHKILPIVNVLGINAPEISPGALVFNVEGKTCRLDAIQEKGENELFIIFKDDTSGKETYGMRYLYTPFPDSNNKILVDFNKAYNPPCCFTEFATCPIPHPENRLRVRVEAGELIYGHH